MTQEEVIRSLAKCHTWKTDLTPMVQLAAHLGDPQKKLKVVHVAGTNGKGSTCAIVASVLQRAGCRVGRFVSPYILDFRERIQVDGEMIPEDALCALGERVLPAVRALEREGICPTEFDAVTILGFLWFAQCRCDVVVLEAGLGGRIDSTNIVEPENVLVSAITSIALDHTAVLGDTLEQIAAEKSGIFKENTPVVVSAAVPAAAMAVLRRAAVEQHAPLTVAKPLPLLASGPAGLELLWRGKALHLPLAGLYQRQNGATALAVLEELGRQGWAVSEEAVAAGFSTVRFPARMELLGEHPRFWLDGAHNPEGIASLAASLETLAPAGRRVCLHGMLRDKDVEAAVAKLAGHFDCAVTVTPPGPRAMDAQSLCEVWRRYGVETVSAGGDFGGAVTKAISLAGEDGTVVGCGSLYLCAALRPYIQAYGGKAKK